MQSRPDFEALANFRDVATSVNSTRRPSSLRSGLLFRAARPDETTLHDRSLLVDNYQIKTIVDLRTTTELIRANQKHDERSVVAQSIAASSSDILADSLRIPGINYVEINLNGKGFERSLMWQLSYFSLAKVIGYMALGYRMEAIGIIGREVLQPRGLVGLAIDTIEHSQPEIMCLFDLLSQKDQWPVMIHCTQGKDRTGLVVILVLLLCSVDLEAVTWDYTLSEPDSDEALKARLKDTNSIGLDESFARCPQELPSRVKEHIDDKYGSVEQYLQKIGVPDRRLRQIQEILLQQPAGQAVT